jgi:quercetin 2,3-dioxygenase
MDDPRYGTVPTSALPIINVAPGVTANVLAGTAFGVTGPFYTTQPVQMIDLELQSGGTVSFDVPETYDTAMLYVYDGQLSSVNNHSNATKLSAGHIILFDATSMQNRKLDLSAKSVGAGGGGGKAILFTGKKLNQSIAWRGPIVMTTQDEIQQTLHEIQSRTFPPIRVPWDYMRIASKTMSSN